MEIGIDVVVERLVVEAPAAPKDAGRRNELGNDLRQALNGFANRIDRGYGVDVRVGELPAAEDDTPAGGDVEAAVAIIQQAAKALTYLNLEGKPILALPEAPEDPERGKPKPRKRAPASRPAKATSKSTPTPSKPATPGRKP
jgi:hypothetical protein